MNYDVTVRHMQEGSGNQYLATTVAVATVLCLYFMTTRHILEQRFSID